MFMAKLNQSLLQQIQKNVSIVRLVQTKGVELIKQDKLWVGSCLFCKSQQSLKVNAFKNNWSCDECDASGDALDWVMKVDGVSKSHAAELLRNDLYLKVKDDEAKPVKHGTVKKLVDDIDSSLTGLEMLQQVMGFYHQTLLKSDEIMRFLETKKIASVELIKHFKLGYANRSLSYRLPDKNRKAGKDIRTKLQSLGVMRSSGHEHLNGSLVIPIRDVNGICHDAYGRKILSNLRKGTPLDLYLGDPVVGVFNEVVFTHSKTIIFCLKPMDALTFWVNGVRNVSLIYGVDGLTGDIKQAVQLHGIKKVVLAFPQGAEEDKYLQHCTDEMMRLGVDCYRSIFPVGLDVNSFARQVDNPQEALAEKVRQIEWLGNGERSVFDEQAVLEVAAMDGHEPEGDEVGGAQDSPVHGYAHNQDGIHTQIEITDEVVTSDHEVVIPIGDRRYRIRGLAKNLSFDQLKINLLISRDKYFHVDTFDLYHARHRASFVNQASTELSLKESTIKKDLGHVLLKLEELQDGNINKALESNKEVETMSEADKSQALSLLQSVDLMDNIIKDVESIGVVGERTNILLSYLAATSRKLTHPLAVVIQSASASGKSALMNGVLSLMPPEECLSLSAVTGQSLFYMNQHGLKHKVLSIAEEEGASNASYALKLLQSDGRLKITSTGKNVATGRLVTQEYEVEGPVSLFLTTTAINVSDEELQNRCIILTVDESHQHTEVIHAMQRKQQTLEGVLQTQDKGVVLNRHHNAQRLLRPYLVVNPYAEKLTFFSHKTRSRRDHMKYLSLIQSITLLKQCQKTVKSVNHKGVLLHYIETTIDDIALANELAKDVLGLSITETPRQTQKLLTIIQTMVDEVSVEKVVDKADIRFTRKDVRYFCDWGDTQLKIHLKRLAELECIVIHKGGRTLSYEYELMVFTGNDNTDDCQLVDVELLKSG